jgi:MFS family permease
VSAAALGGASIIGLSLTRNFALALPCMLIFGLAGMSLIIVGLTLRQRRTPNHLLGRVSSVFNVLNVAAALVAAPLSGFIAGRYGLPWAVGLAGGCICAAAPLLAVGLRKQDLEAVSDESPADQRKCLGGLSAPSGHVGESRTVYLRRDPAHCVCQRSGASPPGCCQRCCQPSACLTAALSGPAAVP